ncbi:MAG: hypothetical protein JO332_08510 [Planctomycetaceae bacterium]|nr:hypothetical protein [Planctomycetaceae bacterium]
MGQEIVYCSRCQTRLNGSDFNSGAAVRISNYIYCTGCLTADEKKLVEKLTRPPEPAAPVRRTNALKAASASSGALPAVPKVPAPKSATTRKSAVIAGAVGAAIVVLGLAFLLFRSGPDKRGIVDVPPTPPSSRVPEPPQAWSLAPELETLKSEFQASLARKDFQAAQGLVDRARNQHDETRWTQSVAALERALGDQSRIRLQELKEAGAKAADRKAWEELRAAREEVARWGLSFQSLLKEFDEAFAAVLAAGTASPEPPKPAPTPEPAPPLPAPDPGPVLTADPRRSEAGKKYLGSWQKAMGLASRGDYDAAASELKSAARDFKEEDVQKEVAGDLADLGRLQALRATLMKEASALPSWTDVTLSVVQEDGSRAAVRGNVLQAGPRRLELRGQPRFVELEDIAPGSLATLVRRRNKESPSEEARLLALLCALDGDEPAMDGMAAGREDLIPPKVRNYCRSVQGKAPAVGDPGTRQSEWAARRLFYAAELDFRTLETRGPALEKYDTLLGAHSGTAFVKSNRAEIAARKEELKESVLTGYRLKGRSVFGIQKLQIGAPKEKEKVEMLGWKAREEPASDDPNAYVEASFFALPETEYRGWALVGGCCATTFTWFLQASELTYVDKKTRKTLNCDPGSNFAAPWDLKLKGLSVLHGGKGHAKAEKEPLQWEWVDLPMPKYAAGGVKTIRFMAGSKGMAIAAVLISSMRDKRPTFEDVKKLAERSMDDDVPTSSLKSGKDEPDLLPRIPEARPYLLVFDLDLAKLGKPVKYDADHRADVKGPFDRIAYLMELQRGAGPGQYVFVSMDAFTDDINKVGVPDVSTGARFQQKVSSMNVHSNVEGLATGIGLDGGNIEFWPNNYSPGNAANVPGASGSVFDFGDQFGDPVDGYGSMQVHNHKAGQVLFAFNHWGAGAGADLGIGNSPGQNPDWTFTANAASYSSKRLRVLVRPKA